MNIVIMAGGGGSRLWPLSRINNPKQFLDLGSGKTLIEHCYERALSLGQPADIFVATIEAYKDRIQKLLPSLPPENIFIEPAKRDTGPAFAATAINLKNLNRDELPTIFMWSDHVFTNEPEFVGDLKKIPTLITQNPRSIIIMGHSANFPETGLGYIETGEKLSGYQDVFNVVSFKEKPDLDTAKKYATADNYYWNMGYVSLRPKFLLEQLNKYSPSIMESMNAYAIALNNKEKSKAAEIYSNLSKISVDYMLLEKAPSIIVVTGDYGWSDIGNWGAVQDIFGIKGDHTSQGHHIHVSSKNNYIYNTTEKTISVIGLKNTIVVVTKDAVLVTSKDECHKVKDVVQNLEKNEKHEFL